MADFGSQSTQISSGGGTAQPIAPVSTPNIPNQTISIFAGAVENVAKIWETDAKRKAQEQKNTVLGDYAREREKINNGIVSGQIDPTRASTLIRALNTKYLAGNAQYTEDINKINNAFNGSTESEEVIDQAKLERDIRNKDIEEVRSRGGTIYPGMPKYAIDAQITSTKTAIRAEKDFEAMVKRNQESRAQGDYDAKIAEREMKDGAVRIITDIAGANLNSFQQLGRSLVDSVKSGALTAEQAQQTFRAEWSRLNSYITSAGAKNTELIGPFKSLFDSIGELYQKQLDPKGITESLEDEVKQIKLRSQLVLLASPKVRAATAASELLGPNGQIALGAANPVIDEITKLINTPTDAVVPAPQIVGNPDAEKDVFKFLNDSMLKLDTGAYKNNDKAKQEAQTGVNNILKQVGGMVDKGTNSPIQFKATAEFLASPAFGKSSSQGLFDAGAMQTAKKVFQLQYEDVVVRGIQQKMDRIFLSEKGSVPVAAPAAGAAQSTKINSTTKSKEKTKKIGDLITIEYTGTGVQFVGKPGAAKTDEDIREQRNTLAELKTVQSAVNQLVKIGAHMEGTVDYQKYWEANKHRIFPEAGFPLPKPSEAAPVKVKTEKDMKSAVKLSPEEQARSDQFEVSDANLRQLEKELTRGDLSPAARDILRKEYATLLRKRSN